MNKPLRPPRVLIVNKGTHDYSGARRFGELVFMSEGLFGRLAVGYITRTFRPYIEDSDKNDYILLSGTSVMNALACSMFTHKHGQLKLLIYDRDGEYALRELHFGDNDDGPGSTDDPQ